MLPFDKLQLAMARLRFKDETALRSLGLAKLNKKYDAYPILDGAQKIYVLLPRGMEPTKAQKLENFAAASSVVVLGETPAGIAKIWPSPEVVEAARRAHREAAATAEAGQVSLDFDIVEE